MSYMRTKTVDDCYKEIGVMIRGGWKYHKKSCNIGAQNHNWKGGIADYPNHTLLKKNRLIQFGQTKGRCELCGEKAVHTHHKDFSRDNHAIENLLAVCNKCHGKLHTGRGSKASRWIRRYGMTEANLCKKLNCSYIILKEWHRKDWINGFLGKNNDRCCK